MDQIGGGQRQFPLDVSEWLNFRTRVRLCDPHPTLEGSLITAQIRQFNDELAARGLLFRPHFWLSNEWCFPDGVSSGTVAFYLAHPWLAQ